MRVEKTTDPEKPEIVEDDEPTPRAKPAAQAPRLTLAEIMALPEPGRSATLEQIAQSGEQFYLRSRDGKPITQSYGKTVLKLGPDARGFSPAHAIHLLWYLGPGKGDRIEEVDAP